MDVPLQTLCLPDLWQQDAVRALRQGQDVIVDAPTGAGKTRVFELLVQQSSWRKEGSQAVFTVPTRALANDKWAEWQGQGWDVGIATGDLAVNTQAPVLVATLETQRERFLYGRGPALLVVDEYQMISDPNRGLHYELVLTLAPQHTQLLLLSGTVGNPQHIAAWLKSQQRCVSLITTRERPVPLDDVHLLGLPHQAPKSIKGFWPRLAVETLLADMAPLLIFVPHRRGAENVARQIADALPPTDPLDLTTAQKQLAGKELQRMLAKRVCYHHSGLRYELRAGLLEPLARAGQLRTIVATMGLAAGINFSVRSVFVAETSYHDGPFLHELQPDELLQMFGRAGRRGRDTVGFVIHGDKNPRLADARPRDLKRANEIDWPTLVRVMHLAVQRGEAPFAAAAAFCQRLFSSQPISLGIESARAELSWPETDDGSSPSPEHFGLGPTRREILNSDGLWEPYDKHRLGTVPLGRALVCRKEHHWSPARRQFELIAKRTRLGRAKRREDGEGRYLVKEIVLATRRDSEKPWRIPKSLGKRVNRRFTKPFTDHPSVVTRLLEALKPHLAGGRVTRTWIDDDQILGEIDFRSVTLDAYQDQLGRRWLIDPPDRLTDLRGETGIVSQCSSAIVEPPVDSPIHAWRSLGLVQEDGTPTRRGVIFSYFYRGEGLAIAAALEASNYPIDDLLWHLANLRSGRRFRSLEGGDGERLTVVCRQAYGPVNHPGYLRLGLPTQYEEGAAETVRGLLDGRKPSFVQADELGRGDVERAVHEWSSLLRQIVHAPAYEWERWQSLQTAARALLEGVSGKIKSFTITTSTLSPLQTRNYTRHSLRFQDLRQYRPK